MSIRSILCLMVCIFMGIGPELGFAWQLEHSIYKAENDLQTIKDAIEVYSQDRGQKITPSPIPSHGLIELVTPGAVLTDYPLDPFASQENLFNWFNILTTFLTILLFGLIIVFLIQFSLYLQDKSWSAYWRTIGIGIGLFGYIVLFRMVSLTVEIDNHTWGNLRNTLGMKNLMEYSYYYGETNDGYGFLASRGPDYTFSFETNAISRYSWDEFEKNLLVYDISNGLQSSGDIYTTVQYRTMLFD
jgi:hypothetical protein